MPNTNHFRMNHSNPNLFIPDQARLCSFPSLNLSYLNQLDYIPSVSKTTGNEFIYPNSSFGFSPLGLRNQLVCNNSFQTQNLIFNPSFIMPSSFVQGTQFNIN